MPSIIRERVSSVVEWINWVFSGISFRAVAAASKTPMSQRNSFTESGRSERSCPRKEPTESPEIKSGDIQTPEEFKLALQKMLESVGGRDITILTVSRSRKFYSLLIYREDKELFVIDYPLSKRVRHYDVYGLLGGKSSGKSLSYAKGNTHALLISCVAMVSVMRHGHDGVLPVTLSAQRFALPSFSD